MSKQNPLYLIKGDRRNIAVGASILAILGLSSAAISSSLFNVDGGNRAVVYSRISGVKDKVYSEGTHLKFPWIETPFIYDVRAKPRIISSLTGTKDLQMVNITVRVLVRPRVDKLPYIFETLGLEFDDKVLPSIVNEVLKSVVAKFNASQLITQREHVSRYVKEHLIKRAENFNLLLEDVSLTHLTFSPEFTHAVEAKQIAQQEAQRAGYVVEKASQEKQSIIIRAEGEAKSAILIGEAARNSPEFIELRKIDAAQEIASLIKSGDNKLFMDSDILLMNFSNQSSKSEA